MNFWINLGHQLIRKIDDTGGTDYTNGSGRPLSLNPPSSPGLNPVDYSILESLSQRVYKHLRMQHLKDVLEENWEELL